MDGYGHGPYVTMPTGAPGLGHEAMGMAPGMGMLPGEGQDPMATAAYLNSQGMYMDAGMRPYAPQHARGVHVPVVDPGPPIKVRDVDRGPEGCNLFIFHVPNDLTNVALYRLFAPFGPMLSARIMVDKRTGCSRGFGFVSYENHESAANAIKCMNGFQLGHKRLKVELKKEKGARGGDRGHHRGPGDDQQQYMSPGMGAAYLHATRQMDPLSYGGHDLYGGRGGPGRPGMDASTMPMGMVDENGYYQAPVDMTRKSFGPHGAMLTTKMGYPMEAMPPVGPEASAGMWPVGGGGHPMAPPVGPVLMDDPAAGIMPVPVGDPHLMPGAVLDMNQMNHHMPQYAMAQHHYMSHGHQYAGMAPQPRHPAAHPSAATPQPAKVEGPAAAAPASAPAPAPTSASAAAAGAAPGGASGSAPKSIPGSTGSAGPASAAPAAPTPAAEAAPPARATETGAVRSKEAAASSPRSASPADNDVAPPADRNIRQIWSKTAAQSVLAPTPRAAAAATGDGPDLATDSAAKRTAAAEEADPAKDLDKLVESNLRI